MQVLELVFVLLVTLFVARLMFASVRRHIKPLPLIVAGFFVLLLGFVLHGLRWQMIPAYLVFFILAASSSSSRDPRLVWRCLAAIPLVVLLGLSSFLVYQLPVFELPAPSGQYSVGTFDLAVVDTSRIERYNPSANRELGVHVWYPSDSAEAKSFEKARLWESLHKGDWDLVKFFTHYFSKIETNSYKEAPVWLGEAFPVLIFNHGFTAWPEQNTMLVEELASHGYVVFSIAHTYQSTRVHTNESGKVLFTNRIPDDLNIDEFDENGRPRSDWGVTSQKARESGEEYSLLKEELFKLFDQYNRSDTELAKRALVEEAIANREQHRIGETATPDALYDHFYGQMTVMGSYVEMWVKDIQFVLNHLTVMEVPVENFNLVLDLDRVAVMGQSLGSSAAGEFCKIDSRCKAGVHLDGNYQGYRWNTPLMAPFMVFYSTYLFEGNNFAYAASEHDLWNFTHPNIDHMDFTDLPLAIPNLTAPGMSGSIDPLVAADMVNQVTLDFLDRYLKNEPRSLDSYSAYPELQARMY